MNWPPFLDLPNTSADEADVLLLPLPYEVTASYGRGTAQAPEAIWKASTQVELWDEQIDFDLKTLRWHSAPAVNARKDETPSQYLARVQQTADDLNRHCGLVVGVGGEHSVTPSLVKAACGNDDLSDVTIVQFDAHADLRGIYDKSPHSHACAMHRLVESSANIVSIGIRSLAKEEIDFARSSQRVKMFPARQLSGHSLPEEENLEPKLLEILRHIKGTIYLTFDIDALEVHLCPATGTPQPGGLGWWQTLRYLHALLVENSQCRLIGFDLVETVPQTITQVNEFTAASLLTKVIAFWGRRH